MSNLSLKDIHTLYVVTVNPKEKVIELEAVPYVYLETTYNSFGLIRVSMSDGKSLLLHKRQYGLDFVLECDFTEINHFFTDKKEEVESLIQAYMKHSYEVFSKNIEAKKKSFDSLQKKSFQTKLKKALSSVKKESVLEEDPTGVVFDLNVILEGDRLDIALLDKGILMGSNFQSLYENDEGEFPVTEGVSLREYVKKEGSLTLSVINVYLEEKDFLNDTLTTKKMIEVLLALLLEQIYEISNLLNAKWQINTLVY